jgi:hypothetical protein
VSDGLESVGQDLRVTVTDVEEGLLITSPAAVAAPENQLAVVTVTADDPDGGEVTFSLSGGDDELAFSLAPDTGVLTFKAPPDFEAPTDAGGDNVYQVSVTAFDGVESTEQTLSVTVTDVAEAPEWQTVSDGSLALTQGATFFVRARLPGETSGYGSTVTVTNISGAGLTQPLRVVIESTNKPVRNADGLTDAGEPYFLVDLGADGVLAAGESATVTVLFERGARAPLVYGARVERLAPAAPELLLAAEAPTVETTASALTEADVAPLASAAVERWVASGQAEAGALSHITVEVADLPGLTLAELRGDTVFVDADAAGHGWFVDSTPLEDSEFRVRLGREARLAAASSPAHGTIDLLSVISHELGHALDLSHTTDPGRTQGVMSPTLETGVRRVPLAAAGDRRVRVFDPARGAFDAHERDAGYPGARAAAAFSRRLVDDWRIMRPALHRAQDGAPPHHERGSRVIDWVGRAFDRARARAGL